MRPTAFAIPVALLSLVTACGTSSEPVDRTTAAPQATQTTAEPTAAPSTTASESSSGGGAATKLTGELGEKDAFTITLVDDKGAPVTNLKAGTYEIKIKDTSKIHNYHLSGPGVEQTTTIPEVKETTWPVKLTAGTYTYECDPHPNMKKTFKVS